MAHGQRPGTISKILASSRSPCPSPATTNLSQEQLETPGQTPSSLKDGSNDRLTAPVSANHYYMSCEPSPEDMEDTCSEYDNVGSDVEQDYTEVLHLNREGVVDVTYYKQYCPKDGGYIKHVVGDNINDNSSAPDQFTSRSHHTTEICKGSQSDSKPQGMGQSSRSHCAPVAGDGAERKVEKGLENRFFYSDGDELDEVLDGAKFIEDLEEADKRPANLYQGNENERIRKGGDERERDEARVTRNNMQGPSKKWESSVVGSKVREKQAKGRGRRPTGVDTAHVVPGIKGCTTNSTEQRPKTSSKDGKRTAVRSKARCLSSKQHPPPPPRHSHPQPPADTQKSQPCRESPPVPRKPSPSPANSLDDEPSVIKPPLAEQQRESLDERTRQPEKQVTIKWGSLSHPNTSPPGIC